MEGRFHEDLGIWISVAVPGASEPSPALFLDRDGVIVEDCGYLSQPSELVLIPGAADFIATANRSGIPVVEITNQAGIARGYYGWKEFLAVEQALACELARSGAQFDAVLACPYHCDGVPPWAHPDHPARKPRPGMLLEAAHLLNLNLTRSWIAGDKLTDLQAGVAAGLRGGVHVLTGHGAEQRRGVMDWDDPTKFVLHLVGSIGEATALLSAIR